MRIHSSKILSTLLLTGALLTGCSTDDLTLIENGNQKSATKNDDEVMKMLAQVPGVAHIGKVTTNAGDSVYVFTYAQKVDHNKADSHTFSQLLTLNYVSADAPVVLLTNGYHMEDPSQSVAPDLSKYLNANTLSVEHRYFGESQPESGEDMKYTYFSAEQASSDLHDIVTAFQGSMFKNNKWVATGTSKSGITTALYAYYSDKQGWKDMNLFMPFCAPFLKGTPTSPEDESAHIYMLNTCGTGYPAGSEESEATARLAQIPLAIADNPQLRKLCIRQYAIEEPTTYNKLLKNYKANNSLTTGNFEKDVIVMVLYTYYENLFSKFSYYPYSLWAESVPDATTALDSKDNMIQMLKFIFLNTDTYIAELIKNNATYQYNDDSTAKARTRAYDLGEFLFEINGIKIGNYYIHGYKELGISASTFQGLTSSTFLTIDDYNKIIGEHCLYGAMKNILSDNSIYWDGGALMTSFREWVVKQTTMPMLFIYGTNDPWTGGAIDKPQTQNVEVILNPEGMHDDKILGEGYKGSSAQIKAAINKFLGL